MIPIVLNPLSLGLAVVGNGGLALRRLLALRAAGAARVLLFAEAPEAALAAAAGAFLRPGLPDPAALQELRVLWIADLEAEAARLLAAQARAARVLVNVEDRPEDCDFHSVAEVRRGDLLLTVSTNGAAPGLAGNIRRHLQNCFGNEWAERVREVAGLRAGWREQNMPMAEAARRIDALVAEHRWLRCPAL